VHQQPIFEEWNVQYHLGYLGWGSRILQYTIPGGHCTRKIMPLNNPPAQFSGLRNPLYRLLIWLVKKRQDNTKGRHKGLLLKDTKNHSSVYHGPSLNTLHTDCTKGRPKGVLKDTKNHSSVYQGPSLNILHTDCTKGQPKGLLKDTKNHSSVYLGPSPIHCIRIVAT
jgi:hypothetical protein